jgi:hypothetical protein
MKEGYTHISVVLDRSGSMSSCKSDVIGGYNQLVEDQKKAEGTATLTLAQFDTEYEVLSDMVDLKSAKGLTDKTFVPRGSTALLDAIGRTIVDTDASILGMDEKDRPENVIFVIITDGEENASRETSRDQAMQMINSHRTEKQWEFVFIGANQDAIQGGASIGVRASSAMTYDSTGIGTRAMYTTLSDSLSTYRSKKFTGVQDKMDYKFFDDGSKDEPKKDIPPKDDKKAIDTYTQGPLTF